MAAIAIAIATTLLVLPTRFVLPDPDDALQTIGKAPQGEIEFPIEVLVWNIAKGGTSKFESGYRQLAFRKSLILIQEYHENPAVKKAMREPAGGLITESNKDPAPQFIIGTSFLFRSDDSRTGVATGSRAKTVASQSFTTRSREPIARTPKATLVTEYRIANSSRSLLVVNIHGINVAGFDALCDQLNQVRPVVASHHGPVVFGGDFNTNTQAKLEFVLEYMEKLRLTETIWSNDQRMTAPFGVIPLDYVFTRGLASSAAQVMGKVEGSDHKAMVFTIDGELRAH